MKKKPEVWNVTHSVTNDADIRAECKRGMSRAERRLTILDDQYGMDREELLERIESWRKRLAACGKGAKGGT